MTAAHHQAGTWVKIGCDERDDIMRKAGGREDPRWNRELSLPVGWVTWYLDDEPLFRDSGVPIKGDAHCSHERFVPAEQEPPDIRPAP